MLINSDTILTVSSIVLFKPPNELEPPPTDCDVAEITPFLIVIVIPSTLTAPAVSCVAVGI